MSGASLASVGGGGRRRPGSASRSRPRSTASRIARPRRRSVLSLRPRICARRSSEAGRRLATSTSAASARTLGTGRSVSRAVSSRQRTSSQAHGALGGLERVDARQAVEDRSRARARRRRPPATRHSSSAQSRRPRSRRRVLQRVGELEQVQDVLARVADLLLAQRPRVPARERRALAQAHADHLVQQRLVAELRAQPGEPGGDLGVEDVRAARWTTRGAAARRPGARRAGRSGRRGRRAGRPAARGRTPRSADRGPRRGPPSSVSTAIWTRHSSAR